MLGCYPSLAGSNPAVSAIALDEHVCYAVSMKCTWHLCENELSGRKTKFCSIQCNNKYQVTKKRRNLKATLVEAAGSKCVDCGYTGPAFMFDFDHRDPKLKSFSISDKGVTVSLARLQEEVKKCDLVCANCHRFRTHVQRCLGCEHCARIP